MIDIQYQAIQKGEINSTMGDKNGIDISYPEIQGG